MSAKLFSVLGFAALASGALFASEDGPDALNVNISADFGKTKDVYKNQVGIFYEDLGRAADGGLCSFLPPFLVVWVVKCYILKSSPR